MPPPPQSLDQKIQQALALHQAGQLAQAEAQYREIAAADPGNPGIIHLLGVVAYQQGNITQAIETISRAVALNDREPLFYFNLGKAHMAARQHAQAEASYRKALHLHPGYAEAYGNLGNVLEAAGRPQEAIACYRKALQFRPSDVVTLNNLGLALHSLGHNREALPCFERALSIRPNDGPALNSLGNLLLEQGLTGEAITAFRKALASRPDAVTLNNLGNAHKDRGEIATAKNHYEQALATRPDYSEAHSNLLFTLLYANATGSAGTFKQASNWARQHSSILPRYIHQPPVPTPRPLRIAYVSADFHHHPVGFFIANVLANHDKTGFNVYCYYNSPVEDELTSRLRQHVSHWRNITALDDEGFAAQIHADQIDILVDLAGHTGKNRLLVFARKPAPVQVTWLGYCDTTGLNTMDYLLADAVAIPPDTRQQFTEKIWRLPGSYLCYQEREYAPVPDTAPSTGRAYTAFGCFNNLSKVTPEMVKTWALILRQLPDSRMVMKAKQFRDDEIQSRYLAMFLEQGLDETRLDLRSDYLTHAGHLACYNDIDIALDTFPYNGVTTTCEAAWMGVPTVTLAGESFISRNGASILASLGLSELVATNPQQYVDIAVNLASDLPRLGALRSTMRARFAASPLGNPQLFTRNLEQAYREMWQQWCATRAGN